MTRVTPSAAVRHPRSASPGLGFGGDYNPEQWPETTWLEDVRLMRQAGVTFVTVGVFSWARIEPEPGRRHLDWLERVLDLLDRHEIAADLATATASPPPWLTHAHPEVLPVDRDGRRLEHGSRQAWCPSSRIFRDRALALVEDLAARFSGHPALAMWHVSNELGCHNAHCYCDVSAAAFRAWLERRYGTLEALNQAWGTAFWSQRYSRWEEIQPPRRSTAVPNPTQQLDFRRFSSDELLDHYLAERAVLRRHSPHIPVTTNFMVTSHIDALDYWSWAREQDVVSNDHYLDGRLDDPHVELAFCADWTRGLAGGRPWVLMEHSTSAVNWQPRNYAKRPGQMRRNTLQHVARGADTAGFFQWRASRSGAEKYHSAMLPHSGVESRVWREVVELGESLRRLGEVADTEIRADVALLLDYECWWAVERESLPLANLRYLDRARDVHRALWDAGITNDVCHPAQDLSGYRVVIAPMLHLVTDAVAAQLTDFVSRGGHLVTTYFSGVVDENDHIRTGGFPGAFRSLLGVRVEEFCPLPPHETVRLASTDGANLSEGQSDTWVEDLHLTGGSALYRYADGPLVGTPAVTRHAFGSGVAWYVGTRTAPSTTAAIIGGVLAEAGVPGLGLPPGVEVVRRSNARASYLFVLNHSDEPTQVPAAGYELLTDTEIREVVRLDPGGVACVREDVR